MAQYTVDHVQRMKQIKATLDESNDSADIVQQKQDVLEELLEIVDNIDYARGQCIVFAATQTSMANFRGACAC